MKRFEYAYEMKLDDGEWLDVSPLVDSRQTSIERNICTTRFKSSIDTAVFTMKAPTRFLDLRAEMINLLMGAVDNMDSHVYVKITEAGAIRFLGVADLDSLTITTLRIPQPIQLSCRDISVVSLDDVPTNYLVLEYKKVSQIVEAILADAGYVVGTMDIAEDDDVTLRAFVLDPDEDDTYRDYLDTLLFEMGGYVLDCDTEGVMNVVRIPIGEGLYEGGRLVDDYLVSSGIQTSTSRLDTDGVRLQWSTLSETDPNNPQTIYVDDIDRQIDDEGNYVGLSLAPGDYWPEGGDQEPTYLEYEAEFLDREYQSRQKKDPDRDLSIILVRNPSASINVWDSLHRQMDPDDAFDRPIPEGYAEQTNPTWYPTKAWWLLRNRTQENVDLTSFSIQGDVVYRSRLNTMLMPDSSAKPEEYESIYIYDAERARRFASFYHNVKRYAHTTHTWTEKGVVVPGTVVKIAHKTTDIGQAAYIVQVKMSYLGGMLISTCTAISVGPYDEYPYRSWGSDNGTGSAKDAVWNMTDLYLASDEYEGVTTDTPGWSTDAGYGSDSSSPFLWKYTRTQYVNGKIDNTKPVIVAVKGEAKTIVDIDTQYAITEGVSTPPSDDSWQEDIPVKSSQSQVIWTRQKVTYSDGTVEYMDVRPSLGTMIQYAWSPSPTIPPKAKVWRWRGKYMAFGGKLVGSPHQLWTTARSDRPGDSWFLWIRWSFDNGISWTDPQCISSEPPVDFSINGPDSFAMDRQTVVEAQALDFSAIRVNGISGDCVWMLDDAAWAFGFRFVGTAVNGIVGDEITVSIPEGQCPLYFVLTASLGGLERTRKVSGTNAVFRREYLGRWPQGEKQYPEKAGNDKPLRTGDSITFILDTDPPTSTIMIYDSDLREWLDTRDPDVMSNPKYSQYIWAIVMDSMYDIADSSSNNIQPANDSSGWSFFKNIGAVQIVADSLFALFIRVMGAIFGGGYNKDGTPTTGQGFHFSASGLLQAVEARFTRMYAIDSYISGVLQAQALYTRDPIDISVTCPALMNSHPVVSVQMTAEEAFSTGGSRDFDFSDSDGSYVYYANGIQIGRIPLSTGKAESFQNGFSPSNAEETSIYFDVSNGMYSVVLYKFSLPLFGDAGFWDMFSGGSFSSMTKVNSMQGFSNSAPFPGQPGFCLISSRLSPRSFVELSYTNTDGIWSQYDNNDFVVLSDAEPESGKPSGRAYRGFRYDDSSWKGVGVIWIKDRNTLVEYRDNIGFIGYPEDDAPAVTLDYGNTFASALNDDYRIYSINDDLIVILYFYGGTLMLHSMTSFSQDALEKRLEMSEEDHFSKIGEDRTTVSCCYLNGYFVVSMYNFYDKLLVFRISRDLSSWTEYSVDMSGVEIQSVSSPKMNSGLAVFPSFMLFSVSNSLYEIAFTIDDIINDLHSLEGNPLQFRSKVSGTMSYMGETYVLKEMLCSRNALSVKTGSNDEFLFRKGDRFPLPLQFHDLVIISNSPANITKDLLPEVDGGYDIGSLAGRYDAYIEKLDVNRITANDLPSSPDGLDKGDLYMTADGTVKCKN